MEKTAQMYESFVQEYGSDDAIRKYTSETAGYGINYLLDHDYADIYLNAINTHLKTNPQRPLRILEFGCGGGMNIIRLVALLEKRGIPVEIAYGTDFSPRLVEAAGREAKTLLPPTQAAKLNFYAARNEKLVADLAEKRGRPAEELLGYFDLIIGVNTLRYCHRFKNEDACARDIFKMLRPGGVCVNIDMNNGFPAFRSRLRGNDQDPLECYLPTLDEYASPFQHAGFEILKKGNFCWVPHSAGRGLTLACRVAAPILNVVARSRAMRSLVVSRRPA